MESRVLLPAASNLDIIIERLIRTHANSKSRLSLARALDPFWSARVQLSSQVKTASRQEAGGNQINFNANLPASCRPQSSRLTTLFRSQVRAPLVSCRRSERKTSELKCENNRFNRAGFHRTATVYRAIFFIFQYFAILLTYSS